MKFCSYWTVTVIQCQTKCDSNKSNVKMGKIVHKTDILMRWNTGISKNRDKLIFLHLIILVTMFHSMCQLCSLCLQLQNFFTRAMIATVKLYNNNMHLFQWWMHLLNSTYISNMMLLLSLFLQQQLTSSTFVSLLYRRVPQLEQPY